MEAFNLSKENEKTKQMEYQKQIKVMNRIW